jgi:hypothetical protein
MPSPSPQNDHTQLLDPIPQQNLDEFNIYFLQNIISSHFIHNLSDFLTRLS